MLATPWGNSMSWLVSVFFSDQYLNLVRSISEQPAEGVRLRTPSLSCVWSPRLAAATADMQLFDLVLQPWHRVVRNQVVGGSANIARDTRVFHDRLSEIDGDGVDQRQCLTVVLACILSRIMAKSGLGAFLIKELKEALPPMVFFAVGFNLIVLTTDLILADYARTFFSFLVATATALVVGKSVLVADALPLLRCFNTAPLIQTVLFKAIVYWAVVFLVRFLEKLVEYLFAGGTLRGIPEYVAYHYTWHRFAAIQIWIFVLFLVYTSIVELNAALGDGGLLKIFFGKRSSESKLTVPVADSGARRAQD